MELHKIKERRKKVLEELSSTDIEQLKLRYKRGADRSKKLTLLKEEEELLKGKINSYTVIISAYTRGHLPLLESQKYELPEEKLHVLMMMKEHLEKNLKTCREAYKAIFDDGDDGFLVALQMEKYRSLQEELSDIDHFIATEGK